MRRFADPARLEIQGRTRYGCELRTQTRYHMVCGHLALFQWLQRGKEAAGVRRRAASARTAGEGDHRGDRGISLHDFDDLAQTLTHGLKRGVLICLDRAREPSGILLREESFGDDGDQVDVDANRAKREGERQRGIAQHERKADVISVQEPIEDALAGEVQASVLALRLRAALRQHGRGGQGNNQGYENRDREGHGKFAE